MNEAISALNPSTGEKWEKCLKFGENRRNIQTIYDSVRKKLQDEITVLDRS